MIAGGWALLRRSLNLGGFCDVKHPEKFARQLTSSLHASEGYVDSEKAALFREYHKIQNFQRHWMRELAIYLNRHLRKNLLLGNKFLKVSKLEFLGCQAILSNERSVSYNFKIDGL